MNFTLLLKLILPKLELTNGFNISAKIFNRVLGSSIYFVIFNYQRLI